MSSNLELCFFYFAFWCCCSSPRPEAWTLSEFSFLHFESTDFGFLELLHSFNNIDTFVLLVCLRLICSCHQPPCGWLKEQMCILRAQFFVWVLLGFWAFADISSFALNIYAQIRLLVSSVDFRTKEWVLKLTFSLSICSSISCLICFSCMTFSEISLIVLSLLFWIWLIRSWSYIGIHPFFLLMISCDLFRNRWLLLQVLDFRNVFHEPKVRQLALYFRLSVVNPLDYFLESFRACNFI